MIVSWFHAQEDTSINYSINIDNFFGENDRMDGSTPDSTGVTKFWSTVIVYT